MSLLNVSEKTVKVFSDCGFDILKYFEELNQNMDIVLRVLQYHSDVSNPNLSLEQRKALSVEFFDFMDKDDVDERFKKFVSDLRKFDKDLAQCVVKKDVEAAKEVVTSLIPDIDRLEKFVKNHKKEIKKVMKWMYDILNAYNPDSKLEELHLSLCPNPNKLLLLIIVILVVLVIFLLYQSRK